MSTIRSNFNFERDFEPAWIKDKIDENCIAYLENFGLYLCDKKSENDKLPGYNAMTTSQIRNVFGEVRRIASRLNDPNAWDQEHASFLMLRPKIAYNTARALVHKRESKMIAFKKIFDKAHTEVKTSEQFTRFMQFLEGVIAFHKVYGGKD